MTFFSFRMNLAIYLFQITSLLILSITSAHIKRFIQCSISIQHDIPVFPKSTKMIKPTDIRKKWYKEINVNFVDFNVIKFIDHDKWNQID